MSTPNLPPLVSDATITLPAATGEWTSQNVNLDKLADSLALPRESLSAVDLRSVPDVWAQALVFQHALVQPGHALHDEALSQWRAVLALFALEAAYDKRYELRLQSLSLEPEIGEDRRARALFRRVLAHLPPSQRLPQDGSASPAADWSRPVLVHVRARIGGAQEDRPWGPPQLLGMLNPATLVATGKATAKVRLPAIAWMRNGPVDPTRLPPDQVLSRRDYMLITAYLEDLGRELERLVSDRSSDRTFSALNAQLHEYADRCRILADGYSRPIETRSLKRAEPSNDLYAALRRVPVLAAHAYPEGYSETAVFLRDDVAQDVGAPFKGLVLFDPALATTLRRRPQDIHVWREHTLKALSDAPALLDQVRSEMADAGYLLVTPDDFFTREFARLGAGAIVEGHRHEHFRNAVLPLSPLVLLSLRPDAVIPALAFDSLGDGASTVTLRLPLMDETRRAGDTVHPISRTFEAEASAEGFKASERVNAQFGVISTWPDFRAPEWRWNLLKLSYNPQMTGLQCRFGVSGLHLARTLNAIPSPGARAERARVWFDSSALRLEQIEFRGPLTPETQLGRQPDFQRLRYRDRDDLVEELQISTAPFEAVCVSRKGAVADRQARPLGLVLLAPTQAAALDRSNAEIVAVDFGTTNTVACFADKQPVVFKDRVRLPISQPASDVENRRDFKWSFVDFLPLIDYASPIPTVAKHREIDVGSNAELKRVSEGRDDRPFFLDMIFFQPPLGDPGLTQTRADVERLKANQKHLSFNLKWDTSPRKRDVARRFLREFMLLTGAELVARRSDPAKATWRFSYPEAMTDTERDELLENIRVGRRGLFESPEEPDQFGREKELVPPLVREGAAAANYFVGYKEAGGWSGPLAVVLDIGGGTTDIAILSNAAPAWRNSFRLAGGDFVTHFLMNHPEYFEHIGLPDLAELRRSFTKETSNLCPSGGGGDLKALGELLFSDERFGRAMSERYSVASGTPEGKGLRHSAWIFLGGLAYYLGLVTRRLLDEGAVRLDTMGQLTFGLAGRGSTLFKRYESVAAGQPSALNSLFGLFILGAGLDLAAYPDRRVLTSPKAKMEVVLGMIGATPADPELRRLEGEPVSRWMPLGLGLAVESDDGTKWLDSLSDAAALTSARKIAYPETLPEFDAFLRGLADVAKIEVDPKPGAPDGAYAFIAREVFRRADIHAQACAALTKGQTPPALEPPFITALRALLDRAGRPLDERATSIAIKDL